MKTNRLSNIHSMMKNMIGAEEQWRTAFVTTSSIIEEKEREQRRRLQG